MTEKTTNPPKHLSATMRNWWVEVTNTYDMTTLDLRRLQACCEAWDRMTAAREVLAKDGMFYTDANGSPRKHPACNVEAEARIAFLRAAREIGLDTEAAPEVRPPVLKGRR